MISVSDNWKEAQKQYLVPYSDIQIEYLVTEPGVQEDASSEASPEETVSRAATVVADEAVTERKYSTLEKNLWLLNGTLGVIPAVDTKNGGFVSSVLSGEDGTFSAVPTLTISFSEVHEGLVPGISVVWSTVYNEYPVSYRVTTYRGETRVAQITVTDNDTPESALEFEMQGYDKIVIEILKWCLPRRRARMQSAWVGLRKVYTKVDLTDFSHEQTADLLSGELPKNSIVFSLDNTADIWNPENPSGIERYLIERQKLVVKYGLRVGGEMEWIKAGTFYMSEWNTPANGITASFTARDVMEFCAETYTGRTSGTLLEIAQDALSQSGVDLDEVALDASLANSTTTLEEDHNHTCAEILQMAANAARCVMYQDRNGVLRIEPLNTTLTDYIIGELDNGVVNTYEHPEVELTKELKSVSINKGMGMAVNSSTGFAQEADNPLIVDEAVAASVAEWCRSCLKNRSLISGTFRADPRLDVLDRITVVSKYSSSPMYVTEIKYTYGGAFRGTYSGRVIKDD